MLEPLLFDKAVSDKWGAGHAARGFNVLRHSLFIACAQDIAKISHDSDERTPCISRIVEWLKPEEVIAELREQYAVWKLPAIGDSNDPEVLEALRRIELKEEAGRRAQFDILLCELNESWASLSTSPELASFKKIRNKISAHTEIRHVADKYVCQDISSLGLKWGDLKRVIGQLQRQVECIGLLVRNAGFAWESLDHQLSSASESFWGSSPISLPKR